MPRKPKDDDVEMTYSQVMAALAKRHPTREYALLTEVRNGTGFGRDPRTADAIALSLWPSRGLTLHGFEVKRHRGDWMREKTEPAKADAICRFCDYWWLVLGKASIIPDLTEVPETWGVLAPQDADTLRILKPATKMPALDLDRSFVAAILRNASDSMTLNAVVEEKVEAARKSGYEQGERTSADVDELKRLRLVAESARQFEEASGLCFKDTQTWSKHTAKQIGETVKIVLEGDETLQWRLNALARMEREVADLLAEIKTRSKLIQGFALVEQSA